MLSFIGFTTCINHKLACLFLHVAVAEARHDQIKVLLLNLADFCLRHLSNLKLIQRRIDYLKKVCAFKQLDRLERPGAVQVGYYLGKLGRDPSSGVKLLRWAFCRGGKSTQHSSWATSRDKLCGTCVCCRSLARSPGLPFYTTRDKWYTSRSLNVSAWTVVGSANESPPLQKENLKADFRSWFHSFASGESTKKE